MRNLVRRQAFRQEIGACPKPVFPSFFISFVISEPFQRLMVKGGHLHEALLLSDSQAAEFIRLDQRGFAPAQGVFTELEDVLLFKISTRRVLGSGSDLHKPIPINLVTKTSASSDPCC